MSGSAVCLHLGAVGHHQDAVGVVVGCAVEGGPALGHTQPKASTNTRANTEQSHPPLACATLIDIKEMVGWGNANVDVCELYRRGRARVSQRGRHSRSIAGWPRCSNPTSWPPGTQKVLDLPFCTKCWFIDLILFFYLLH